MEVLFHFKQNSEMIDQTIYVTLSQSNSEMRYFVWKLQ